VRRLQQRGKTVHIIGLRVSTGKDLENFLSGKYTAVEDLLGITPAKGATAPPVQMDQSIPVEKIVAKLDGAERRLNFVAFSHFRNSIVEEDFSAKSLAFNKAVERGLIDLYQIPNPKNP
jgi:hypothetical protein